MSRIHSTNTSIEVKVRKALFANGFRFRKNVSSLPGKPDIVLKKYNCAVFIHGCFWHMHNNCKRAGIPKSRTEFWINKLNRNVQNDIKHIDKLNEDGWRVIVIWECEIERDFDNTIHKLIDFITRKE